MDIIKEIDEYYNKPEGPPKLRDYFYVTEAGRPKTELYNNLKTPKSFNFNARTKRIFDNGNYVHQRYMKVFAEMGMLIAAELTAVNTDLVHGRADCIISDKKDLYVVEIKSASQWTFNGLTKPMPAHKLQLMFYMYFLNISKGIILYENKDNQMIKVFDIELDKEMVEKEVIRLQEIKDAVQNNTTLPEGDIKIEDIVYE